MGAHAIRAFRKEVRTTLGERVEYSERLCALIESLEARCLVAFDEHGTDLSVRNYIHTMHFPGRHLETEDGSIFQCELVNMPRPLERKKCLERAWGLGNEKNRPMPTATGSDGGLDAPTCSPKTGLEPQEFSCPSAAACSQATSPAVRQGTLRLRRGPDPARQS